MGFDGGSIYAKLYLDREPFQKSADEAIAEGTALEEHQFDVKIGADQTPLDAGLAEAEAKAQALADTPVEIPVEVDTSGIAAAAQAASNALNDAFSTEGIGRQIGRLLGQGLSPADAQDYLTSIVGFSAKDARAVMTDYFDRQAATAAAERSSAVADAMAAAMLPTEEQFRRAYDAGAYRLLGAAGSRYSQGYGFDLLSPTAAAMSGLRGPLALPAAGQTTVGLGPADPFAQQLRTAAMFTLPTLSPGLQAFAPGGVGGGIGGLGGGAGGGGGFMGRAANLEEGKIFTALGMGTNAAGALALGMPVILSFGAALATAAISMTALGIAAAPTALAIEKGVAAVHAANTALAQAIPGTTQYAAAAGQVGMAWAGVPAQLQGAVGQILNLMSGQSPLGRQVQGWLTGDISAVTSYLSGTKGSSIFTPMIVGAEKAFNSIPSTFVKAMGWSSGTSGLSQFSVWMGHAVGPAVTSLTQLGAQFVRIFEDLAHLGEGGQGMALLVQLAKTLADTLGSPLVVGFFRGFVTVDRAALSLLDTVLKIGGVVDRLLGGGGHGASLLGGIGEVAGIAYGGYRLARLFGMVVKPGAAGGAAAAGDAAAAAGTAEAAGGAAAGAAGAEAAAGTGWGAAIGITSLGTFAAAALPFLAPAAVPLAFPDHWTKAQRWALSMGIRGGSAQQLGYLYHLSRIDPAFYRKVQGLGGTVGRYRAQFSVGEVMRMAGGAGGASYVTPSSIAAGDAATSYARMAAEYSRMAGGAAPPTTNLAHALDVLRIALEQTNASLVTAAYATGMFSRSVSAPAQSYASMVTSLQRHNNTLAAWATQSQQLLARGANPQFVAFLAKQAPQDMKTMVDATAPQLKRMQLEWAQAWVGMGFAAQKNFSNMDSYIEYKVTHLTGVLQQGALAWAKALNLPIPSLLGQWGAALARLGNMFGGTAAQIQGLMSSAAGRTAMHGGWSLPHRALGGPVSALQAYLVGERGPELFVPGQSGAIVPNSAIGGSASAGTGPSVQVNLYIDATGATDPASVQRAVKSAAASVIPQLRQAVKQGIGRLPR